MPADLDLRKLRYFHALATHLNYTRAAEELHIAQPVLTRQVRALERELGVQLFSRSSRGTALTGAGHALLQEASALLPAAAAAQRRVHEAAREHPALTVGFMPGVLPTALVRGLSQRFPRLDVRVVRTSWDDQVEALLDGRVDVSLVRLPVRPDGVRLVPLFTEPRVVVLPLGHPLLGAGRVRVEDLAELELLQDPAAVPEWRDAAAARGVDVQGRAPRAQTVEEKLELVAGGRGIVVLPRSTATAYPRTDLAWRVVADLEPGRVAFAVAEGRSSPLLRAAEEIATRTLRAPGPAGP